MRIYVRLLIVFVWLALLGGATQLQAQNVIQLDRITSSPIFHKEPGPLKLWFMKKHKYLKPGKNIIYATHEDQDYHYARLDEVRDSSIIVDGEEVLMEDLTMLGFKTPTKIILAAIGMPLLAGAVMVTGAGLFYTAYIILEGNVISTVAGLSAVSLGLGAGTIGGHMLISVDRQFRLNNQWKIKVVEKSEIKNRKKKRKLEMARVAAENGR